MTSTDFANLNKSFLLLFANPPAPSNWARNISHSGRPATLRHHWKEVIRFVCAYKNAPSNKGIKGFCFQFLRKSKTERIKIVRTFLTRNQANFSDAKVLRRRKSPPNLVATGSKIRRAFNILLYSCYGRTSNEPRPLTNVRARFLEGFFVCTCATKNPCIWARTRWFFVRASAFVLAPCIVFYIFYN